MLQNTSPQWLTAEQAGIYTNTSERFIRRLITERRIAVTRMGKHVRLSKQVLDTWIEQNTQPASDRW